MQSPSLNAYSAEYTKAYGILCSSPQSLQSRQGLYPSFCLIEVDQSSIPHRHFEEEHFYIIDGAGEMTLDGITFSVAAGDLIRIAPFVSHQLKNSGQSELRFLSAYSEHAVISGLPGSAVISTAPPTPNGPIHLGHISGPYLASDIIGRYLSLRSVEVESHCGTDDHQNYVALAAQKKGIPLKDFRTAMRNRIKAGFDKTGIKFDEFYEPAQSQSYQERITSYFQRAISAEVIRPENIQMPFCLACDVFLRDGRINGTCPNCGSNSSGACEECGVVTPAYKLLKSSCTACGISCEMRDAPVFTFDLAKYLPAILSELESKNATGSLAMSSHIVEMIAFVKLQPQYKVIVSYPTELKRDYGSEICFVSLQQSIHVWFEMAAQFEQFALDKRTWIHCFGFDNSFYYLLFIPALHQALNSQAKIPDHLVTNEFLHLEGAKFSTSRNHAIWTDEFTGNVDHLRLYLTSIRPSQGVTNFSASEFAAFSERTETNLKVILTLAKESVSTPTAKEMESTMIYQKALIIANRYTRDMEAFLSPASLDLRLASRRLTEFLDAIVSFDRGPSHITSVKLLIRAFAVCALPLMPTEARQILSLLGYQKENVKWVTDWATIS